MYDVQIFETIGTSRRVIDTIHNNPDSNISAFAAAKARVAAMGVSFMEDDVDYIDCADAFMTDGRILAIQPVGFTLTKGWRRDAAKAHAQTMQDAAAAFDAEFLR
jgi:hypothetical protein